MTHAALTPLLGREFDSFLFAPIDDDGKESSLSVVSALARLDVDPWGEAAGLARMPKEQALKRLTSLIASLPKGSEPDRPPEATAARLIALLPRARSVKVSATARVTAASTRLSRSSVALGLLVLLLVGYFIFTTRASSAPGIAAYAAASTRELQAR
jgi:hypothetical protein